MAHVTGSQPAGGPGGAFQCTACSQTFATVEEQRAHCKSERHVYNTKRRLAGLKPISQELWERKLRDSSKAAAESRGTAHLKEREAKEIQEPGAVRPSQEELPWTPECCLFDRKRFESIDECLGYMWRTYNFAVPDREYCTDLPGLLGYLNDKITDGNICLYCNRKFPDAASCRRHMLDKNHTRIGTDALSRRGRKDDIGSEEMQDELQDFFDFTSSTREVTERIVKPQQKVASLLRFFDADRNGLLNFEELEQLWAATGGGALSDAQYSGACGVAGADPAEGLDAEGLGSLYDGGLADLDAHFVVLQDLLMRKLSGRKGARRMKGAGAMGLSLDKIVEDEETEDDEEEDSEEEDGEEDDSDGSEVILECEDEDEFQEVMRVLGLQPATLLDNGDLRLPNGQIAVHREVSHIWKQRGTRTAQLALAGPDGTRGALPPQGFAGRNRAGPLASRMLTNGTRNGVCQIAMSHREQVREGKRILAYMRHENKMRAKLGIQQNLLQKKSPAKFKTIMGDMSGGH